MGPIIVTSRQLLALFITALLLLLFFVNYLPAHGENAVVRMSTLGGSGVVIWTAPGRTLILSSGHMAGGGKIRIEAPNPWPSADPRRGAQVLAVDKSADLMLVVLHTGPLPFVCPVAPPGHQAFRLVSVGYDELRWPAVVRPAHVVGREGPYLLTRELPWHGRSGGGLIDPDNGLLVGVVSAYQGVGPKQQWQEVKPGANGLYSAPQAIHSFLGRYAPEALGGYAQPGPPGEQRPWWTPGPGRGYNPYAALL